MHVHIPLDWTGSVVEYLQESTGREDMGLGLIWHLDGDEAQYRAMHLAPRREVIIFFEAAYIPGSVEQVKDGVVKLSEPPVIQDCFVLSLDGVRQSQVGPLDWSDPPDLTVVGATA